MDTSEKTMKIECECRYGKECNCKDDCKCEFCICKGKCTNKLKECEYKNKIDILK